jgi:hypothetical protein
LSGLAIPAHSTAQHSEGDSGSWRGRLNAANEECVIEPGGNLTVAFEWTDDGSVTPSSASRIVPVYSTQCRAVAESWSISSAMIAGGSVAKFEGAVLRP